MATTKTTEIPAFINLHQQLAEPFPREMERTVNKSGTSLTYLPIAEVITRVNKVIGVGKWSSQVVNVQRDAIDPDWVIAHVRVTLTNNDGTQAHYDGVGGQQVKRKKTGDIVDLGDEFKGAVSDALKKALQQIGIGLYLARTDDAIYAEEAQEAPAPELTVPAELWERFKAFLASSSDGEKAALREWWNRTYPGQPSPKPTTATPEQVEACIVEITRLRLGAEVVADESAA